MERLASFISGGGTTMDRIIEACQSGEIPDTDVGLVIASTKNAGGIEKAKKRGIPSEDVLVINPKDYLADEGFEQSQLLFGEAIIKECRRRAISVITQNGWVKHTPRNVIREFDGRIFNQHPGDPKHFGGKGMIGLTVHDAVIRYWTMLSPVEPHIWDGAKTHVIAQRVDPVYDAGAVVLYEPVPVLPFDTPETLQQRALPLEHKLQIKLLQQFVAGDIHDLLLYKGVVQPYNEEYARLAKQEAIDAAKA